MVCMVSKLEPARSDNPLAKWQGLRHAEPSRNDLGIARQSARVVPLRTVNKKLSSLVLSHLAPKRMGVGLVIEVWE